MRILRQVFLAVAFVLVMAVPAVAMQSVDIRWSASPSEDVVHYRIYLSEEPGAYLFGTNYIIETDGAARTMTVDVGPNVGGVVYFVVTAVNAAGHESGPSNEITRDLSTGEWLPPLPPTDLRIVDVNTGI